ncbi:hypothetical protein HBB16_15825 [Pseudonocardia sp. MCCB 268]|nr:hypothetical protein [Pseudonocardia cytotoxica]
MEAEAGPGDRLVTLSAVPGARRRARPDPHDRTTGTVVRERPRDDDTAAGTGRRPGSTAVDLPLELRTVPGLLRHQAERYGDTPLLRPTTRAQLRGDGRTWSRPRPARCGPPGSGRRPGGA